MAIYYCDVCVISRGKGQSAVAAAAYRSAQKLRSEIDGKTKNYREKTGVVFTEIITPQDFNRYCLGRAVNMRQIIRYQAGLIDAEYAGTSMPDLSIRE